MEPFQIDERILGKDIAEADITIDKETAHTIIQRYYTDTRHEDYASGEENYFVIFLKINGIDGVVAAATDNLNGSHSKFGEWIHIKNVEPKSIEPLGVVRKIFLPKEKWSQEGKGQVNYSQIQLHNGTRIEFGTRNSEDARSERAYAEIFPSLLTDAETRDREQGLYDFSEFEINDELVGKELYGVEGIDEDMMLQIIEEYCEKNQRTVDLQFTDGKFAFTINGIDGIVFAFEAYTTENPINKFIHWVKVDNIKPQEQFLIGTVIYINLDNTPNARGTAVSTIGTQGPHYISFGTKPHYKNPNEVSTFAGLDNAWH